MVALVGRLGSLALLSLVASAVAGCGAAPPPPERAGSSAPARTVPATESPATTPPAPTTRGLRLGADPAVAALIEQGSQASSAALAESQVYARSYAIVIGVSEYDDLPDLPGARADAERVARALAEQGFHVIQLRDGDATRVRLVSELSDHLPRILGDNDRVLVYFAGHGHTSFDRQLGYLMPKDGSADSPAVTGISMEEVQQWLTRSYSAKHVLFVADACYSGLALRTRAVPAAPSDPEYLRRITSDRLRFSLVAGSAQQVAHETDEGGVFTSFFLAGLTGAADRNEDGLVTSEELSGFVEDGVSSYVSRQWGVEQEPQMARMGAGEFVFFPGVQLAGAASATQAAAASSTTTRPNLAGDLVRAQNALAAAQPACEQAELARGVDIARGLERFRVRFPSSETQAEFLANTQRLVTTLADGSRRLQEAARLIRSGARSDPRCAEVYVDAYELLGRVAERYHDQLRGLRPSLPRDVLRGVAPADRPELQHMIEDTVAEGMRPALQLSRCAAATSYVLGSRAAESAVVATPAATQIAERLATFRPAEVEACLESLRDAEEGIAPFVPGETDPSCGHAIEPPPLALTLPIADELPVLATPAALSVYEDVRALAASARAADALVELRRIPGAETSPDLVVVAGVLSLAAGDRASAARSARSALAAAPGHRAAKLLSAALELDTDASFAAVREVVASAVRWDTPTRDALMLAGRMLLTRRRAADALSLWELAAQHGQTHAAELAVALSLGHGDGTLGARLAARLGADGPRTLVLRSQLACSARARDEALAHARRALELDPAFAPAHLAVAEALSRDDARPQIEEAQRALAAYRSARARSFSARRDARDAWAQEHEQHFARRLEQADLVARVLATDEPAESEAAAAPGLDERAVGAVVRQNLEDVRYCFEDGARARPGLSGRVTLRFVVGIRGEVLAAIVADDAVGGGVGACIAQASRRWVFPAAPAATAVSYPFEFTPAASEAVATPPPSSEGVPGVAVIAQDVERCYVELTQRREWARGRVSVSVTFSAAGTILGVRLSGDRVAEELEPCVRAASAAWSLPAPFEVQPGASATTMQGTRSYTIDLRPAAAP